MSNNLGNNGLVRPSGAREGMHRGPGVSPRRSGPTPQATCVRPSGAIEPLKTSLGAHSHYIHNGLYTHLCGTVLGKHLWQEILRGVRP